jgi:hypothetical protein
VPQLRCRRFDSGLDAVLLYIIIVAAASAFGFVSSRSIKQRARVIYIASCTAFGVMAALAAYFHGGTSANICGGGALVFAILSYYISRRERTNKMKVLR